MDSESILKRPGRLWVSFGNSMNVNNLGMHMGGSVAGPGPRPGETDGSDAVAPEPRSSAAHLMPAILMTESKPGIPWAAAYAVTAGRPTLTIALLSAVCMQSA